MTDPADLDQLLHAVSLQGATIGRPQELLLGLLGGLRSLTERHNHGLKVIMEQIRELAQRLPPTSGKTPIIQYFSPLCGKFVQPIPAPREPRLPPLD